MSSVRPRCSTRGSVVLLVLIVGGCGGSGATDLDRSYAGGCAIEVAFSRDATPRQVDYFVKRMSSTPHVERVELLSREEELERFAELLRESPMTAEQRKTVMARAQRESGKVLLALPDDDENVQAIIAAHRTLPGSVVSIYERD